MQCDCVLRLAGLNPYRPANLAPLQSQFHQFTSKQIEPLRQPRTDNHRVVPGNLARRPGAFLQPPVVRKTSIPNRWVRSKYHFDFPCRIVPTRWTLNNRSEEHTSELQSRLHLVCRLPL